MVIDAEYIVDFIFLEDKMLKWVHSLAKQLFQQHDFRQSQPLEIHNHDRTKNKKR